jgi:hypothetical protein
MANRILNTAIKPKKKVATEAAIEYVIPLGGDGWVVKNSKSKTFTVITDNKREALTIARGIAKNKQRELVIYGRNGQIEKTESYVA